MTKSTFVKFLIIASLSTQVSAQGITAYYSGQQGQKPSSQSLSTVPASDAPGTASGNPLYVNTVNTASGVVGQSSATTGQSGMLTQGAVTATAPTYTSGNTNPISITTAGGLRVDGSATTQPVSGTIAVQANYAATPAAVTDGNNSTLLTDNYRNLRVRVVGGASSVPSTYANDVFFPVYTSQGTGGFPLGVGDYIWNGSNRVPTFDVVGATGGTGAGVTAVGIIPSSAVNQGIVPVYYNSVSGGQNVKSSAGNLWDWRATQASAAGFIVLINTTAVPAASAAMTPLACEPIASGSSVGVANSLIPDRFATGITIVFSTSCTTYTSAGTISLRVRYM